MRKKGQVAVFVVIGLIVVATLLIFSYSKSPKAQETLIGYSVVETIRAAAQSCVEQGTLQAIQKLGREGIHNADRFLVTDSVITAYVYFNKTKHVPTVEDLEESLEYYAQGLIADCYHLNYIGYEDTPLNETLYGLHNAFLTNINVKALVSDGSVNFKVDMPISISLPQGVQQISKFRSVHSINLMRAHNTASDFINLVAEDDPWVDMTYLLNHKDYEVSIVPVENNSLVVQLKDKRTDYDFLYEFALELEDEEI